MEYQRQYGKFKLLYYDPRGYLYEPHTGNKIPIGTREVDNYEFPPLLYNKILYVEKKGFVEPFLVAKIPERYDMAIVAAEGYSTEAMRTLFQNADKETDYKLFVLHDSDPYGYNIARTLREETERMPDYHVDVIDLGLNLDEALKMGLKTEDFTRKKAIPQTLKLTPLEKEYFTGEKVGENIWRAKRIELNAMPPAQRIEYLERKLVEHGATAKVLPPDEVLEEHAIDSFEEKARGIAKSKIEKLLNIDVLLERAMDSAGIPDLRKELREVKKALQSNPPESWADLTKDRAAKQAEKIMEALDWEKILAN
ncbi:MAG: toprim domain-containing protein [Methanothrix sp.]